MNIVTRPSLLIFIINQTHRKLKSNMYLFMYTCKKCNFLELFALLNCVHYGSIDHQGAQWMFRVASGSGSLGTMKALSVVQSFVCGNKRVRWDFWLSQCGIIVTCSISAFHKSHRVNFLTLHCIMLIVFIKFFCELTCNPLVTNHCFHS